MVGVGDQAGSRSRSRAGGGSGSRVGPWGGRGGRSGAGSRSRSGARVADLDVGRGRTGRTPARPCARPGPGRPGRCCRAATPSRSWRRCATPTRGTPRPARGCGQRDRRQPVVPARQRRLPGLGVHAAVVDGLDPGGEQPVELEPDRRPGAGSAPSSVVVAGDLDEELLADGAGRVGRAARCQRGAGPFPRGLPPNRTCPFPSIRLSSDYCVSGVAGCRVDVVVAGAADHEGLAAPLAMTCAHAGLRLPGPVEVGERADVVHLRCCPFAGRSRICPSGAG